MPLTSAVYNNVSSSQDFDLILAHLSRVRPNSPVILMGFSMGAALMYKYLGDTSNILKQEYYSKQSSSSSSSSSSANINFLRLKYPNLCGCVGFGAPFNLVRMAKEQTNRYPCLKQFLIYPDRSARGFVLLAILFLPRCRAHFFWLLTGGSQEFLVATAKCSLLTINKRKPLLLLPLQLLFTSRALLSIMLITSLILSFIRLLLRFNPLQYLFLLKPSPQPIIRSILMNYLPTVTLVSLPPLSPPRLF
jgi:hypothetical protein